MICTYLRHIDLASAYEQLDSYNLGYGRTTTLANIHPAVAPAVAIHLEDRAISATELLYGDRITWTEMPPADLAAEVSDYIERDIEALADWCEILPPACEELPDAEWLEQFQVFAALAIDKGPSDYLELQALLICLYDCACWLYSLGNIEGLMQMLAQIEETAGGLAYVAAQNATPSRQARAAAKKRHEPTNRERERALAEWDERGANYSSKRAFARLHHKEYGVLQITVERWIAEHQKSGRQ